MSMYNLIAYSNFYSKTSGILWQYYRDELAVNIASGNIDFSAENNNSVLFKFTKNSTQNRPQWCKILKTFLENS